MSRSEELQEWDIACIDFTVFQQHAFVSIYRIAFIGIDPNFTCSDLSKTDLIQPNTFDIGIGEIDEAQIVGCIFRGSDCGVTGSRDVIYWSDIDRHCVTGYTVVGIITHLEVEGRVGRTIGV